MSATAVSREAEPGRESSPSPAVALRGLWREYDERPVLRDLSLALEPGSTLAVLGPNGAGKTTLLRILATLLRPTAGSVRVLGSEIPARRHEVRGRIGYLGHEAMLYRDLTIAENLQLQARLHGMADPGARIAELTERAGIAVRASTRARDCSAGMLQRAAACRALLHDPALLLLDEPLSHLDPRGAADVGALLGSAPGRTRVIVSHDVEAAIADSDRALVLGPAGAVAYEGPAGAVSPAEARALYGGVA